MYALNIKNLCKRFINHKALDNFTINIQKGEFLCLLGKNGAGKTTFTEIICSLIIANSGNISILGNDFFQYKNLIKTQLGLVPQEFNLSIWETCLQVLITQAGYFGIRRSVAIKRAKRLLIVLDLWNKRDAIVFSLSGGMKRRLMIARALIHDPQILFFDEPTTGVDVNIREVIWKIMTDLNKIGKTIILTTHYIEEAERLCRSVAIIDKGKIVVHNTINGIKKMIDENRYCINFVGKLTKKNKSIKVISDKYLEYEAKQSESIKDIVIKLDQDGIVVKKIYKKNFSLEKLFLNAIK